MSEFNYDLPEDYWLDDYMESRLSGDNNFVDPDDFWDQNDDWNDLDDDE